MTAGLIGWVSIAARQITPRTEFTRDPSVGELIVLEVPPRRVLESMTSPVDAGPIYWRAIGAYELDPSTYGRFTRAGRASDLEDIPAISILVEAAASESGSIFAAEPARIVNLSNEKPELEALITLGNCAWRAGMLIEADRPREAMQYYEAVFSLGAKLYRERLIYPELEAGLNMMAQASALIARLDPSRAAACKAFDESRRDYMNKHILPVQRIVHTLDQPTIDRHAGDVMYLAREAQDRMWRVESIFALARYRFNAGTAADQLTAMRILRRLCDDRDPVIRAAAIAGRDMTEAEYRMLR
jgi:hypothetical protein